MLAFLMILQLAGAADKTEANCRVYGTYMNGACFSTEHAQLIEAAVKVSEVDGKKVGTCGAKERTETCLREALTAGKLKLEEIKNAKARKYLERLTAK